MKNGLLTATVLLALVTRVAAAQDGTWLLPRIR